MEGDTEQLCTLLKELGEQEQALQARWQRLSDQRLEAQRARDGLKGQHQAPPPPDVTGFTRVLKEAGIAHHLLADVIEIIDEKWRAAAEGVLRGSRWVVVLDKASDEGRAMALAERAASLPPVQARMIKQSINANAHALDRAISHSDFDQFMLATGSGDYAEGVKSFFEKRPPNYTGA